MDNNIETVKLKESPLVIHKNKINLITIILFIPFVFTRKELILNFSLVQIIGLLLAASWSCIGPILIDKYYKQIRLFRKNINQYLYPKNEVFIDEDGNKNEEEVSKFINKNIKIFNKDKKLYAVIWSLLIVLIFLLFPKCMTDYGFYGFKDIYYYIFIGYLVFLGNIQAIGFSAIKLTLNISLHFSRNGQIVEDILENLEGKGLKLIGTLSYKTTLYFFSGILYIPILMIFILNQTLLVRASVYILMTIYIIALLLSFFVPNVTLWKTASYIKEKIKLEIKDIYNKKLQNSLRETEEIDFNKKMLNEIQVTNLYNHIQFLDEISVKPVTFEKIFAIIISGLIPLIIFFYELYEVLIAFKDAFL